MKPLYTEIEYYDANASTLLKCECYNCTQSFSVKKKYISHYLKLGDKSLNQNKFCSTICANQYKQNKINVSCCYCNNEFKKLPSQIKKFPNHFCSSSCAAKYNNTHKTKGNRRSKLENYLEQELIKQYPDLEIHFNSKDAINSELDIFIPLIKLAFELNGLFHYEPIFGSDKLNQITNNDNRKFQACLEKEIELCIIDTSQQKYFKEQTSQIYLNIITNIIKERLLNI